jgi:hypothetical protein
MCFFALSKNAICSLIEPKSIEDGGIGWGKAGTRVGDWDGTSIACGLTTFVLGRYSELARG